MILSYSAITLPWGSVGFVLNVSSISTLIYPDNTLVDEKNIFFKVIIPIIKPGIIATILFSFSLSFDEFVRTIFVTGFERTIPVQFWGMIVDELAPQLPAMAVIIILISILI